jgi:hypothetical protein
MSTSLSFDAILTKMAEFSPTRYLDGNSACI